MSDEPAPKTIKNLLKTNGIMWTIAAGQTLYNAENGWQKKDVAYTTAMGQVAMAALSLWRGYAEDESTDWMGLKKRSARGLLLRRYFGYLTKNGWVDAFFPLYFAFSSSILQIL